MATFRENQLKSVGCSVAPQTPITEEGEKELSLTLKSERAGCRDHSWLARYGVFESVPRAMFLAWLYSEQENAWNYLNWSSDELKHRLLEKNEEAARCLRDIHRLRRSAPEGYLPDTGPIAARVYRWMKTVSDSALLKAQIEVLEQLWSVLEKMPPTTESRATFLESVEALQRSR
jgi:hypothetical protein